jgi:hypothetical protein
MSEKQELTSFPNDNLKHIDYVIVYEVHSNDNPDEKINEINKMREDFFIQLKKESIDIYTIEYEENDKKYIYALLHCSLDRLLQEAETIKLEMKLKNVRFLFNLPFSIISASILNSYLRKFNFLFKCKMNNELDDAELPFLRKLKSIFSRKIKDDDSGNIIIFID